MASHKKSLYEILGLSRDASAVDVDLAYQRRRKALEEASHVDPTEMTLARDAHDVLRDPRRRAAYDASLTTSDERAAAAASRDSPDLVLEPEGETRRKVSWVPIALGVVALLVIVWAVGRTSKPETETRHADAMPGTQVATPPAPPPPSKKSGPEIIAVASTSGGQVLSYSMSGQAIPIGLATSTEAGTMITTCHGIPAGAKLVVRVQGTSYPADLLLTDEVLDLCRLQVAGFTAPPARVATADAAAGDAIFAVGVDQAGNFAATAGTVKRILDTSDGKLLELSMPIGQFSSGGGVYDESGELVGISMFQHRSGLSVAYPASWIAQMRSRQAPPPAPPAAPAK
jgi:curved DNA-binding protein CbpA